jgi:pyruvate/oxaloacetate carboxyltransferase
MDKTPRQVAHEIVDAFIDRLEREDYERDLEIPIAQAIEAAIAHARPQIEAEARAAAIEDVFKAIEDDREELPRRTCDKIISLAAMPK